MNRPCFFTKRIQKMSKPPPFFLHSFCFFWAHLPSVRRLSSEPFCRLRLGQFWPAQNFITAKNWTHGDLSSVRCYYMKSWLFSLPQMKLFTFFPPAKCLKNGGFTINISIMISIRANHAAPLWSCMLIWALMNLIFVELCCQLCDCIDRVNVRCNSVGGRVLISPSDVHVEKISSHSFEVETQAGTGKG